MTLNQPTWMGKEQFREFVARFADAETGEIRCSRCGTTDDLAVDHVVSRHEGGSDDIDNLQPHCRRCNSQKGARPDAFWRQPFYWDAASALDLAACRAAQRQCAWEMTHRYAEWFSRPWSQISRRLYTHAWIVGAGKTAGMAVQAFALNSVINRCGPARPRVARLLVLTKEAAIRDQIAQSLRDDLVRLGIVSSAPRVRIVTERTNLMTAQHVDRADVWVSCIQSFWQLGGEMRHGIARLLRFFGMIAFDEPHFGSEQVLRLVDAASSSLCFGFTGSPVEASGEVKKRFVLASLYDFESANANDHSLRFLDTSAFHRDALIAEIDIESATCRRGDEVFATADVQVPDYARNIRPVLSVATRIVEHIRHCDGVAERLPDHLAPHREWHDTPARVALGFPAHAMIRVETVQAARFVRDHLNEMFGRRPYLFPRDRGFWAEVVHAEAMRSGRQRIEPQPLTQRHPWLRAFRHQGQVDADCARILIAVGMAREGVNNPFCCAVGVACRVHSITEHVQRTIGRQLRAVSRFDGQTLLVAPARMDAIFIATHKTFGNVDAIVRAIDFCRDMGGWLGDMETMESLVAGVSTCRDGEPIVNSTLTIEERIDLAGQVGSRQSRNRRINAEAIANRVIDRPDARAAAIEWIARLQRDPKRVAREMAIARISRPLVAVIDETPLIAPSIDELRAWARAHKAALIAQSPDLFENFEENFDVWREFYLDWAKQFQPLELTPQTNLETIRRDLAAAVRAHLGPQLDCEARDLHRIVALTVKRALGIPRNQRAANGSEWDIPQIHLLLTHPANQRALIGGICCELMQAGCCENLRVAFGADLRRYLV